MSEFKYVVTVDDTNSEQMFIFPKNINHDEFAEVLSYITQGGSNWKRVFRKPISAGFTDLAKCYGKSETLDLTARIEDSALLRKGGW